MNIIIKKKVCDECGKILVDDKEKIVRENFISIKGSVCLNSWLNNLGRYSYLYMTQGYNELHDFCSIDCFGGWVNERRKQAIKALYNVYLDKVALEGESVELEHFGITNEDLKFIKIKI